MMGLLYVLLGYVIVVSTCTKCSGGIGFYLCIAVPVVAGVAILATVRVLRRRRQLDPNR